MSAPNPENNLSKLQISNSTPQEGSIDPAWIRRHEAGRNQPAVLTEWIGAYPYQVKLVVAAEDDATEALAILQSSVPDVPSWRIHLMPEGADSEMLGSREGWLIDFCKKYGYRYCNRLHIHLVGNTKGT